MRQLGTVPDQQIAQRFADYLLTKGIPLSIDPATGGWAIWVRNEDHLEEARRQFAEFSGAPDAPVYRDSARAAEQLRAEEQRRAAAAKKNMVNVGKRWGQTRGASGARVTALLLGGSIAVAVFSNLGGDRAFVNRLTIDNYAPTIHGMQPELLWTHEPWRLVTPIFLHFGMMHILFNMLMLWQLGIPIERGIGSLRYLLLVLVIAIPSNFAEYVWDVQRLNEGVRNFGGMSGVLYGLFGYIWMKSRYEPQSGFMISSNTVIWMVGWFFLCLTGYLGNIANVVHGAGLVVGMIVGRFPSLWQSMR
ncbi:MAG TPA: rhomboid family intramembrane serine protease [Planctomycetaceae bacterium]|jgi:GlpG protein|nr:rhomboid family intramembrane serine protease [Planctomycetaceae bacterium]